VYISRKPNNIEKIYNFQILRPGYTPYVMKPPALKPYTPLKKYKDYILYNTIINIYNIVVSI
jgi:hypothetical protein